MPLPMTRKSTRREDLRSSLPADSVTVTPAGFSMTATGGIGERRRARARLTTRPTAAAFRRKEVAARDEHAAGEPRTETHRPEHAAGEPRAIATIGTAFAIALIAARSRTIRPEGTRQRRRTNRGSPRCPAQLRTRLPGGDETVAHRGFERWERARSI
mmetsp:Transcript_10420/g.45242  ORF Transcript_10420/g.45242 Transcript_10420/m.45242 type:complete len:158 (+) Transcript_10420:1878-2351(+)